MKRKTHTHPCCRAEIGCSHRVPCDGEEVENYDGAPGVICLAYHLVGGRLAEIACEACRTSRCPDCGSIARLEPHDSECPTVTRAVEASA